MRLLLFGTGECYRRYAHWFDGSEVLALIDNDAGKQGGIIDGHMVIAPEQVSGYEYDAVVVMSYYLKEMKEQLLHLGVDGARIYHLHDIRRLLRIGMDIHGRKKVLLLSFDLLLGGPSLALYNAALVLKANGLDVTFASMFDGPLRERLLDEMIPVVVDTRLQEMTMGELTWTCGYDLIICNTINYYTFLSDRNTSIPAIWWLHDSALFYDGIDNDELRGIDVKNLKILSVGPVSGNVMKKIRPDIEVGELLYGVGEA